jgi:hypothetical protein
VVSFSILISARKATKKKRRQYGRSPGAGRGARRPTRWCFAQDPTNDLDALDTLDAVIVNGLLYRRSDLDRAREAWSRHFDGVVFDAISMRVARATLAKTVLRNY